MMKTRTPWDDIDRPRADYNVRLTGEGGLFATYWGKDPEGNCLFIIELKGDNRKILKAARLSIRGVEVTLHGQPPQPGQMLVVTLTIDTDRDLFFAMCQALAKSLRHESSSKGATTVALNHLKRWQRFFAGRNPGILSLEEVRGLFAELQVLQILYTNYLSRSEAVEAWCGPEGEDQDFVFEDTAVEVKAISGRDSDSVRIASENQLESQAGKLFLIVMRLIQDAHRPAAMSLNEYVRQVRKAVADSTAVFRFEEKLAVAGYAEIENYDTPAFYVAENIVYRVQGDFPRIIRLQIPRAIHGVRYKLHIDALNSFSCPIKNIWEDS